MAEGLLLILSGPSGVGKGTVCRALLAQLPRLKLSVSVTTRRPRPGEEEGREYHFISPSRFQELIEAEAFLEWAMVHGQYYGTLKSKVRSALAGGFDLLLEIDVQGAAQVKRQWDDAVTIFMAPPSMEALKERIAGRGTESEAEIRRRLEVARREMAAYHAYDYLVINDRVETAAAAIAAIVTAEKCKVSRGACPNF
ncbi:MAG: guanylate kinase [Firmicutes bacterium]|jgi:guanylate kinase|nr:guanylate kinase [Bacillota bacterium]